MSAFFSDCLATRKFHCWFVFCAFLIFANQTQVAISQVDSRWIAGDGNWNDVANWDNGVPTGNFNAIIDSTVGVISQDVGSLNLNSMLLNSAGAELVLVNSVNIEDLEWRSGEIGGNNELTVVGSGRITGDVVLETTFNNTGFFQLGAEGQSTQVASVTGAVWNNRPGSVLDMNNGSRFGSFVDNGPGQLNIESNSLVSINETNTEINWDVISEGTLEINNSNALFLKNYAQLNSGHLVLNNGTVNFTTGSAIRGTVSGVGGVILGGVGFDAVLEPGGKEIGSIQFAGSLPMSQTTVSNFQVGPNSTSDSVSQIGGGLQLDGTLNIEALPGATTGIYTLFTYNNGFMLETENIQLGDVPDGFEGELFHDVANKSVKLDIQAINPVILPGDVNQDGVVNLLDVASFIARISDGEFQAEADINQDGSVNLLDVNGFVLLLAG